jgi:cytochrome c biogenesis factor
MITELGHFALALALIVALIQASVPLIGASRGIPAWMALARPAAFAQVALVGFAFLSMVHAFVTSDFSVVNVARNSITTMPLLYKVTGVWGSHEGSLLLWITVLMFLTLGIGLGSWWSYYTLGWGGWWVWDPVENVSFMPWLAGTALLHSAIVVEKREALKSWTILLAIVAFSLSLMGTFLVRSGL